MHATNKIMLSCTHELVIFKVLMALVQAYSQPLSEKKNIYLLL